MFLIACVVVGQTQSPMRRLRIVERRGLEPVRIDCSAISNSIPSTSHDMIYGNLPATAPLHQRITVPPITPTSDSIHPSLFIRVSSEPNVDESSCYGSLHIELDPQTMLPLDNTVCGSNWLVNFLLYDLFALLIFRKLFAAFMWQLMSANLLGQSGFFHTLLPILGTECGG